MELRFALEQARREHGVAARVRLLASAVVTLLSDAGLMRVRPTVRPDVSLADLNVVGASDILAATPAESLARTLAESNAVGPGLTALPDDLCARLDAKATIACRYGKFWEQSWATYDAVRDQLLSGQLGQTDWPDDPLTRLGRAAQYCETERSRCIVSLVDVLAFRNRLAKQGYDTAKVDQTVRESTGMKLWKEEFAREDLRTRFTMETVLNQAAKRNQPRKPSLGMGS